MAGRVVGILGNGPPEDVAGGFVVPDFRQAEGQDEDIGRVEDALRLGLHPGVVGGWPVAEARKSRERDGAASR